MIMKLDGVELKQCPFCASGADLKRSRWEPDTPHFNDDKYWVKCRNVNCAVSPTFCATPEMAASRWDARS